MHQQHDSSGGYDGFHCGTYSHQEDTCQQWFHHEHSKVLMVPTALPTDPCLMRGPLREVLDPSCACSDEEVRRALEKVHLTDLAGQPQNIFMEVCEGGSNLSAGQRQLVCLARALLRKPRILVLDEATSHMDGDTDRLVQRALREGFRESTMLTIAHRLDTVLDHDRILVMDGGQVAEFGPTLQLALNPSSRFHAMLNRAGLTSEDVRIALERRDIVSTHL
ncbi:putative multidrug resistance-associated protein lethal(2)03659 [Dermacentor variabilis]|uniref:putative multidrug resistance-associated protein lethal(2)03659 n=1 Tax=Dermacentor variabilis TaxID=34621 RepID=UPI003F5C3692